MNPLNIVAGGNTALNKIRELVTYNQKLSGNVSLTDLTKSTRVEPIVIVSQDCMNIEFLPDVMQSCQGLFIGCYLQAVSLIANVKGVSAARVLDKLNPNGGGNILHDKFYGTENYKFSLPKLNGKNITLESFALEAESKPGERDPNAGPISANIDAKALGSIYESSNLSIGKMFNVTIQKDDVKMTVPISVRLLVNAVSEKAIISMLTLMSRDSSFKERWHSWRAGSISWKDLVFANDLIRDAKKMMQNDKEGVISEIFQRSNNAKLNSLFGDNGINLASASNIYIITTDIANEIERKTGTKLNSFKAREEMLKSGYTMILVVIDKTWERVTFYHRGIPMGTTVGVKDMKASNKGNGPDIMDFLKAYMLGNNPSL